MSSYVLTFAIIAAVLLAGSSMVLKESWLNAWKRKIPELVPQSGPPYNEARFGIDLVDQINYARTAEKMSVLRVDPELAKCPASKFESMDLTDLNTVTKQLQDGNPRHLRVPRCPASSPEFTGPPQPFPSFYPS